MAVNGDSPTDLPRILPAMGIATVERDFGELLAAFGDLVVAHALGRPADPDGPSVRALSRRYRQRRRAFAVAFGAQGSGNTDEERRATANIRGALPWLDELERTPGVPRTPGQAEPEDRVTAAARASLYRRYGVVGDRLRVGSDTVDRLTLMARLTNEPDADTRRALFESLGPLWRTVDGDGEDASPYRRLLRSSAARWAAHGSPVERNAVALGMPPASIEGTLQAILAEWRRVIGPARVEPWDYWYTVGAAARRVDRLIPVDRLLEINHRYLSSLGADPAALGVTYDVRPRAGRPPVPVAFTIAMGAWARDQLADGPWAPRPPWVFANYAEGGLGNLSELLHESGHALHVAAVRARPAFLDWSIDDAAFLEGTADVVGWDADEPAWQRHWLGEGADPRDALLLRYGGVVLDIAWALFEIELHRHPDRRPNDVWTEIATYGLGIEPHPEWSWWAMRGQLIDLPGYLANYALSAMMAAAIRERTWDVRGSWYAGDPEWYSFMSEHLFRPGASRSPAELVGAYLGRPLTAGPLLADLRRAR
jgi:hypothetical protein